MAVKKKSVSKKPRKRPMPSKPQVPPSLTALLSTLTQRSYFELEKAEKALLQKAITELSFRADGWSFVPHPDVIDALRVTGRGLSRYILTIETVRAKFYFAVRDFLASLKFNVSSYYTGGSADFVCDITATEEDYKAFYDQLSNTLQTAGLDRLSAVKKVVSVWKVEDPLVLCRKELSRIGKPDSKMLKEIIAEPAKFQTLYRDYTSDEARTFFKSDRDLAKYVQELRLANIIVGFRPLLDGCRYVDREYVPLCRGRQPLENMLETRSPDPAVLLEPTIELLSVLLIQSTDPVEREVSHIFINEYKTPGERNDWRSKVYSTLGEDLNVFTFPLEGTLNESPIVLSDLSEVLTRAKLYSGELVIGTLSHSELKTPQPIGLQAAALGGQGVTLGISGSGKTNTDCVLITEASKHLKRVIVADSIESHSIRDKQDAFSESTRKLIEYFKIKPGSGSAGIHVAVTQAFSRNGISVIEADKSMFQNMFDACITKVDASAANVGNTPRVLEGMLLVEEANDAFGSDDARRKRVDNLERVLTKAWRKGWCIWLSTQHPSDVGYDNASVSRILRALQNRIFHQLDESDAALASGLLSDDDEAAKKFEMLLTHMKKWTAIVRGTLNDGGTIRPHPPITTAIRELGKELPKV